MVNIVTAQPVNNAGFSHANAAFTAPTSGVSGVGSLSGPFWIQEQTMDYDYARVPLGFLSSVALSLSGATWTSTHTGTVLLVRATANVNTRKSYEWFSTSSYQQGQRFSVEAASADQFGNTYCNVTPSDCDISSFSGTYGVAGRIYTSQKWYKREPWIDGFHTENDKTWTGYNYQAYDDGGPLPEYNGTNAVDAELVWADFHSTFATDAIDGQAGMTGLIRTPIAPKPGTYFYGQDLVDDIIIGTDMCGDEFNLGGLFTQNGAQISFFSYRSGRHDWT